MRIKLNWIKVNQSKANKIKAKKWRDIQITLKEGKEKNNNLKKAKDSKKS